MRLLQNLILESIYPAQIPSFGLYVGAYVRTAPLCRTARFFTQDPAGHLARVCIGMTITLTRMDKRTNAFAKIQLPPGPKRLAV